MGFFDKLKKQNAKPVEDSRAQAKQLPLNITYSSTSNGNLQIDFYDANADFKKFYDTTRLIINKHPINMADHQIYNCKVAWYGENDAQHLDERTGEFDSPRARDYRGVLAEIDLSLLQSDLGYCNAVMKGLMDKQRVERYLENGLQETPEQPCGKYIGGIRQTEDGYGEFFSISAGEASHNSELMVNRRQEHREMVEASRQKSIADKRTQIEKLQRELEDMTK